MTDEPSDALIGLPAPPAPGASALPAETFAGTTVVVTGAGTGLGKAIASEFARLGASIVIASRKPEHLNAGRAAMEAIGAPVLTVECDIRESDSIAAMFDAAVDQFGLPSVLINNAAANFPVPAEDMSPNAWRTVVDITLTGTYLCSREFARRHLDARTPGSIVSVATGPPADLMYSVLPSILSMVPATRWVCCCAHAVETANTAAKAVTAMIRIMFISDLPKGDARVEHITLQRGWGTQAIGHGEMMAPNEDRRRRGR